MMNEMIRDDQVQLMEMIRGIESGTARLKSIVQDLIDVSLIDNRLLSLSIQPVWLDRLFETLEWEIAHTIKTRGLTFQVQKFEGIDQMFFSDPDRLMQVFRNIVSNAIKYTPDGGSIIITGRELPGFIEVIVSDTGIGIAAENQVLIFEKFIQFGETSTHSSSKTRYMGGGPGLGLHITKGILETMGGAIWVDSPGFDEIECPGSSFHILIPLDQQTIKNNMQQFLQQ
jgi:signal transduction histidine kinase